MTKRLTVAAGIAAKLIGTNDYPMERVDEWINSLSNISLQLADALIKMEGETR
jgi:hypothetical protein